MVQEIDFKGLSFSPSDHECQDGDLGCMVNLLNEDGALKAITLRGGEVVGEIPSACNIVTVHKNSGYCHWVLDCVEDEVHTWKWTEKNGTGGDEFALPTGFEPKSVTTMGNMVCFVGETETVYALWKDGEYKMFSMYDFSYTLRFTNDEYPSRERILAEVYLGSNFIGHFDASPGSSTVKDNDDFYEKVTKIWVKKEAAADIYSAIDSELNRQIEQKDNPEEYFKHITLGVAAVRLYDGSLINVSDIFVLGPSHNDTEVYVRRSTLAVGGYMDCHKHKVTVTMPRAAALGDIITGVSIYVTTGDIFINTDRSYQLTITSHGEGGEYDSENFQGFFKWEHLSGEKLYEAIDRSVFNLSKTIKPSEFSSAMNLERVTGAEEAMTLSDFRRGDIGGKYSYIYNNRLHIACVRQTIGTPMLPSVNMSWPGKNAQHGDDGQMYGWCVDHRGELTGLTMDAVFEVRGDFSGQAQTRYFKLDYAYYPFGPILCVPHTGAKSMTMYIKVSIPNETSHVYAKKTMELHQSISWGCSYYVDEGEDGMRLSQLLERKYDVGNWDARADWEIITQDEFETVKAKENQESMTQENVIKVSEVNNPLVFPVGNTVRVGAGKILGLATNTEAISEGQFGVAPLYAFTDEGVWPLEVNNTGTYRSLGQPSSRDVVTDAKSITPIDKGVLFATKRGVMIIRGNQVECLTDSLNGIPWDSTCLPHHQEIMGGMDPAVVDYQRLEDFLPDSRMLYDYARQRVYIYHEEHDYALVLSLRTGLWGAVEKGRLQGGVPWYPETYILRQDYNGKEIVDLSVPSDMTEKIGVMCCSRPLSFEARDVHKSVMHAVVRGLAHLRGSGEDSRLGCALYGSNDLYHWQAVNSSTNQYLRGRYGQPWKWWRIAIVGEMDEAETIDGVTADIKVRLNNRLR